MSEVAHLAWACRTVATACLQPQPGRRPTAAALLDCDFFPQPVRTAAFFLAALHPPKDPIIRPWNPHSSSTEHAAISLAEHAPWLIGKQVVSDECGVVSAERCVVSPERGVLSPERDVLLLSSGSGVRSADAESVNSRYSRYIGCLEASCQDTSVFIMIGCLKRSSAVWLLSSHGLSRKAAQWRTSAALCMISTVAMTVLHAPFWLRIPETASARNCCVCQELHSMGCDQHLCVHSSQERLSR